MYVLLLDLVAIVTKTIESTKTRNTSIEARRATLT
jgi:hypothetical protein